MHISYGLHVWLYFTDAMTVEKHDAVKMLGALTGIIQEPKHWPEV